MVGVSLGRRLFQGFNYAVLTLISLLCLFPIIHILALSLSSASAADGGLVSFWPVQFTMESYKFVASNPAFLRSFGVSVERVVLGTIVNMLFTILIAYPLSKDSRGLLFRTGYAWFFVFSILFSGGLIPWYMTVKDTGLLNSIWALILPGAVPVFNVILLLNFFRGLPKELEEAAFMDGAGYWRTLWQIFVPISKPAIATIVLFTIVGHWNSWFDGLILMNSPTKYPLATYLQTVVINYDLTNVNMATISDLSKINDQTAKAAQIFLGALPVLLVYPFCQKYFMKGIILGSVKE